VSTIELYVTGDQIASFGSVSVSGKSNGTKVTLAEASPLGSATDVFKIVINDVTAGDTGFVTGQTISIYTYPDGVLVSSTLSVDTDAYNGRATSDTHIILDGPGDTGIVIDLNGVNSGSIQIGPGINPPRYVELPFTSLPSTPPTFPCFVKGTLIETDIGPLPIETLRIGDLVKTQDNGLQPIRWIGQKTVPAKGFLAPITFEPGSIGNYRRLRVSPQHRMLVRDWRNEFYFASGPVFVAAKYLVNDTTIRRTPMPEVTYLHLILDAHEVIFAEGVATESLFLGAEAIEALDKDTLAEIAEIFPELVQKSTSTARTCLRRYEAEVLTADISTKRLSSAA
jgi:hypothetical protein